jgi:hypothetical protein
MGKNSHIGHRSSVGRLSPLVTTSCSTSMPISWPRALRPATRSYLGGDVADHLEVGYGAVPPTQVRTSEAEL